MDIQQHLTPDNVKSLLLIVALAVGLNLLLKVLKAARNFIRSSRMLRAVPEAPGSNWLLGHVLPLLQGPKHNMASWDVIDDWLQKRGPVIKFRIGNIYSVATGDPTALKRVFQTRQKLYTKDLELSYHPFLPILGTGLVTSDGDLWQKQRLLMGPALRLDILDDIIGIAKNATDRLSVKLEKYRGTNQFVNVEEEFRLLTLQVIGEAILSLPPEECDRVFPKLYLPVMEEAHQRVLRPYRKYLPIPEWFKFRSRMAQLNSYIIGIIRKRWEARLQGKVPAKLDILDRILAAMQESGDVLDAKMETQLCYEVKTFLLAGHETSAAMLTWSVFELSKNDRCQSQVLAEATEVFGEAEAEPPRAAVDGMQYTLSVLKETLRKYSIVPVVTRKASVDDEILGYKVPAGTMISLVLQTTHKMWKDPMTYSPERFLPGGEYDSFEESVRPYMFLPFIQGPRNCLGQHLALLEARVVLSLLVKRFRFRPAHAGAGQRDPLLIPVGPHGGMEMYIE